MAEKAQMITVEALTPHTAFGKAYEVGDTYEIEEQYVVDSLVNGGMAVRVDRVKVAKAAAKETPAKAPKAAKAGKKVEPMKLARVSARARRKS